MWHHGKTKTLGKREDSNSTKMKKPKARKCIQPNVFNQMYRHIFNRTRTPLKTFKNSIRNSVKRKFSTYIPKVKHEKKVWKKLTSEYSI